MKHFTTPIKLSVSLAALLLSQANFAGGTDAGTVVENTATISYSVGTVPQADITSAVADFKVDKKVDLSVTGSTASTLVSPSSARATVGNKLTYVLSNDGNSTQSFKIDVDHFGADQFDAGTTGATAGPQAAEVCQFIVTPSGSSTAIGVTLITAAAPIISLAKDETANIEVSCSMPNRPDVVDGNKSIIDVLATAVVDASGVIMAESTVADREDEVDIVLADGDAPTGADAAERNAMHSATHTYEIDVPMLTVVKTSTVISDPLNETTQPKRIPGAVVEYTITIKNESNKAASGLTVTDLLTAVQDGEVVFIESGVVTDPVTTTADIIIVDGAHGPSDPAAAGSYASDTVTVTGIAVDGGDATNPGVATVTFKVKIL